MSFITRISLVAFASFVAASPAGHAHGYAHQRLHSYPYPNANSTGGWGSTGLATGASSYTSASATPSYSRSAPGYGSQSAPAYSQGGATLTSTKFWTVTHTVSYAATSANAGVSPAGYASGSGEACGQDVTVTSTEKVYVTVTAAQGLSSSQYSSPVHSSLSAPVAPAYSAPSSVGTSAAPVSLSSAPAYSAPSSSESSSFSSEAAPQSHSTSASAPSYSSPSASSSALPSASAYTAAVKQAETSASSSAPATHSSSAATSSGKRGLAYNSAALTTCFDDSKEITWAYNWVSASAGLTGDLKFVPTLHDGSETFTSVWNSEASASIASGSTTLFSFNEPDQSTQANMSPEDAAAKYIQYMNPFAGKAQLCAPSVTNGQSSSMGLNWLQQFITACNGKCHIDCYNIHWYNSPDAEDFKTQVNAAIDLATDKDSGEIKPVWVSEFGCNGASDDQVSSFLEEVMPWMDSNDSVAGYAYFMASDGSLVTGTEPSTYGKTYMSYTG